MIPRERMARSIVVVRGRKVLLDADLAALYGVRTKALVPAIKRNRERLPAEFTFQLTGEEAARLRSQPVTSKARRGRRCSPHAFTEQGVAMLSSSLRSPRAIAVNIEIMRVFVKLRNVMASHAQLARKLDELEQRYDAQFKVVFDAMRVLMAPPIAPARRVGFRTTDG
jgi:hypothetical protein